ncbi:hypothetical protein OBBRIDRAFT_61024 [Obba rivulosa]|uniref:Uncharacterized protein n=1 Tax=Obba rivulosa TaxID=1052685 RepID=A0A8E2AUZ9_9APHY|nr:hypothetical protein OBBRIDRAFT_61024 [Obba rivulosa]
MAYAMVPSAKWVIHQPIHDIFWRTVPCDASLLYSLGLLVKAASMLCVVVPPNLVHMRHSAQRSSPFCAVIGKHDPYSAFWWLHDKHAGNFPKFTKGTAGMTRDGGGLESWLTPSKHFAKSCPRLDTHAFIPLRMPPNSALRFLIFAAEVSETPHAVRIPTTFRPTHADQSLRLSSIIVAHVLLNLHQAVRVSSDGIGDERPYFVASLEPEVCVLRRQFRRAGGLRVGCCRR